jgi:hypothetical protein
MTQEAAIEQCRQLIGNSLGWGDASSWTNEDFDTLSESLFDKTGIRLSVSTLKRVWGKVKYDSSPTMATLNALARYAGFDGWRDFLARSIPAPQQAAVQPAPRRRSTTPIIIFTIAVLALLSLLSARLMHPPKSTAPLKFEVRRTSGDLPNSVVFDYDASSLHPHSVIIQQSWDPGRKESVPPDGRQHTSIYYYPGYFRARLIVDGEIKQRSDVFIPSNGWKGIIKREPLPVYLRSDEIKQDSGHIGISASTLREKTGSGIFSGLWVDFANVREFPGITGDHFSVETTVRNTATVEECLCRRIEIIILGKLSAIILPLCDKGCISDIGLSYGGDKGFSGKDHDLSAFGCDFSQWQQLKCTEADRRFEVQLNGRTIFTHDQVISIGDIVGVRIDFEGTGQIKNLDLQGHGEKISLMP